jgi:hypothetical protein
MGTIDITMNELDEDGGPKTPGKYYACKVDTFSMGIIDIIMTQLDEDSGSKASEKEGGPKTGEG